MVSCLRVHDVLFFRKSSGLSTGRPHFIRQTWLESGGRTSPLSDLARRTWWGEPRGLLSETFSQAMSATLVTRLRMGKPRRAWAF